MVHDGTIGPYSRLRCECCGCPTLDSGALSLDDPEWPQVCVLCDWENPEPGRRTAFDDGLSLDTARGNVGRFGWMYDPEDRPAWLSSAPPEAELRARRDLREIFATIAEEPDHQRLLDYWEMARDAEDRIRAMSDQRSAAELAAAEFGLDASDARTTDGENPDPESKEEGDAERDAQR